MVLIMQSSCVRETRTGFGIILLIYSKTQGLPQDQLQRGHDEYQTLNAFNVFRSYNVEVDQHLKIHFWRWIRNIKKKWRMHNAFITYCKTFKIAPAAEPGSSVR